MSPDQMRSTLDAVQILAKARMSAGHAAVISDLQALHDHPDTHPAVRAALGPLLAKHAAKAKAVKVPKPHDESVVHAWHQRLTQQHPLGHPQHGPALDELKADRRVRQPEMAELARRMGNHAPASTQRGSAYAKIRRGHDFYESAGARVRARAP